MELTNYENYSAKIKFWNSYFNRVIGAVNFLISISAKIATDKGKE